MFPVYLKRDENDPPPEDDIAFIVGRDGLYVQKRTVVYRATVPAKEIPTLAPVEVKAEYALPPIPAELVMQMFLFFRAVWEREHSEAIVLISWNKTRGTFRLDAPEQHVDSTRCRYELADFRPAEGFTLVGSCHSHGTLLAYHSGKDEGDESTFDGIHLTFGRITDKRLDIVASLAVGGTRFPQDVERVLGGIKFVKNTPPRPVTPAPPTDTNPLPLPLQAGGETASVSAHEASSRLVANDTLIIADPPTVSAPDEGDIILTDAGEVIEGEGAGLEAIIERNTELEPQGPIAERVAQWQEHQKKQGGSRGRRREKYEAKKQAQQNAQREQKIGFVTSPGPIELQPCATGDTVYRYIPPEQEGFVIELPPNADLHDAKPPLEWSAQVHKIEYATTAYPSTGATAASTHPHYGGDAYCVDADGVPYTPHAPAASSPHCKRCVGPHDAALHRKRDREVMARLFEFAPSYQGTTLLDLYWDFEASVRDALRNDMDAYFAKQEITPPTIFVDKLRAFFCAKRDVLLDPTTRAIDRAALTTLVGKYVPEPAEAPSTTIDRGDFSPVEALVLFYENENDTVLRKMILALSEEEQKGLWQELIPFLGGAEGAVIKWNSMTGLLRLALVRDCLQHHKERFLRALEKGQAVTFVREPEAPITEEERMRILAAVMEAAHQSNGWRAFYDAIGFRLLDLPRRDLWRLWRRALPLAKVRVIDKLVEGRWTHGSDQAMAWKLLRDFLLLCGTVEAVWEAITKPNSDLPVIRATEPLVRAFDPEATPPYGVSTTGATSNELDSAPAVVVGDKDANKEAP